MNTNRACEDATAIARQLNEPERDALSDFDNPYCVCVHVHRTTAEQLHHAGLAEIVGECGRNLRWIRRTPLGHTVAAEREVTTEKRGDGDEEMEYALNPVEIRRLCRMILTEDQDSFVLSDNQACALAFLAEWKVLSLQALWQNDARYFERQWLKSARRKFKEAAP